MRVDFFYRLPPPTALLLVSSILDLTSAHVLQQLPRRTDASTTTIPYHALTVVSWPLTPTPPPRDLFALRRRQDNTICGYIDGSSEFPATCSAGSHCVLDTEANVVGCCPNGEAACTAGVFTGCVDTNSGPQTEVNPYVFSCRGGSVCFKNVFEGGFSQFGCGTASDQGTVVVPNASGISTTISYPTITASLTASVSTLSEPTTLGTVISTGSTRTSSSSLSPTSSSTSSSISSTTSSISSTASSISSTTSSSASSTISTSPTSSAASLTSTSASTGAPAASPANDPNRTGAIVGGTIGGLAVLIALVALIVFLIRRKQKPNVREGPGQGGSIRGTISTPKPGPGTGFTAISQDSDAYETGPGPLENPMFNNGSTQAMRTVPGANPLLSPLNTMPPMPFQNDVSPADETSPFAYGGAGMAVSAGASSSRTSYPPSELYGQYPPIYGIANTPVMHGGIDNRLESDQVPLTREIDDFSQGFSAALGRIGEEDEEEDLGDPNSRGMMMTGGAGGGFGESGDNNPMTTEDAQMSAATSSMYSRGSSTRPLWQQNRRQSRNQMWM